MSIPSRGLKAGPPSPSPSTSKQPEKNSQKRDTHAALLVDAVAAPATGTPPPKAQPLNTHAQPLHILRTPSRFRSRLTRRRSRRRFLIQAQRSSLLRLLLPDFLLLFLPLPIVPQLFDPLGLLPGFSLSLFEVQRRGGFLGSEAS